MTKFKRRSAAVLRLSEYRKPGDLLDFSSKTYSSPMSPSAASGGTTFFGDADCRLYRDLLGEAAAKAAFESWAYCPMPNHVRVIATPNGGDGLRRIFGDLPGATRVTSTRATVAFFSARALDEGAVRRALPILKNVQLLQQDPGTLILALPMSKGEVKISFFGGMTFGRVGEPEKPAPDKPALASSLDLLATRIEVIHQRVEATDYQDIEVLLRAGFSRAAAVAFGMTIPVQHRGAEFVVPVATKRYCRRARLLRRWDGVTPCQAHRGIPM
jgi:hypothetical protein